MSHEAVSSDHHVPRARTGLILGMEIAAICLFAVALVAGIVHRLHTKQDVEKTAIQAVQPPVVEVIHAQPAAPVNLTLVGTTQAFAETVIYARVSGYLKKRYVDIGDVVQAGQLLAEIEAPELDQQLIQARAQFQQSSKNLDLQKATLDLAEVTMNRYTAADQEGAVAKALVDQQVAAYRTATAAVAAAQAAVESNTANVQRYEQLTSFERVVAPFKGTITQRNVDVGALITAGSPTDNTAGAPTSVVGTPNGLFQISQIDTLRVFVNIPQVYTPNVKEGITAVVRLRGQFTTPITAKVARTANALDPASRTLLTEVDVPNETHRWFPGMFVFVDFQITPGGTRFRLPSTAVVINAQGTSVATVGADNRIHFRPLVLGRDFGDAIDIQNGLNGDETIVKQPTVSLQEGQLVAPRTPSSQPTN
jgi:RND family efflux transporter MFP subunit